MVSAIFFFSFSLFQAPEALYNSPMEERMVFNFQWTMLPSASLRHGEA
jgi:hypothetical protein